MAYYIWWTNYKYDPRQLDVVHSEAAVLEFLNKYAGNEDFRFCVVKGEKLEYEADEVVIKYRSKNISAG